MSSPGACTSRIAGGPGGCSLGPQRYCTIICKNYDTVELIYPPILFLLNYPLVDAASMLVRDIVVEHWLNNTIRVQINTCGWLV